MTNQTLAALILKTLKANDGQALTRDLLKQFGEQTSDALDLLTARRAIIRVRGVGAFVALS